MESTTTKNTTTKKFYTWYRNDLCAVNIILLILILIGIVLLATQSVWVQPFVHYILFGKTG
jgi:uncharacterized membrane protein YesL